MTEEEQPQELTPPVNVQKPKAANRKKTTGKGKVKRDAKERKPAKRSENKTKIPTDLKCLYHPESPVIDVGRQLCSSCKWKLSNFSISTGNFISSEQ